MCGIGIVIRIRFQSPRFRLRFQSPRFWLRFQLPQFWLRFQSPRFWLRFQSPRFWLRFQSPRFWLRFQSPQFWLRFRLHRKLTTNDSDSNSDSRIGVGIVAWIRLRSQNRPMSVSQRGWFFIHMDNPAKWKDMQNESVFFVAWAYLI